MNLNPKFEAGLIKDQLEEVFNCCKSKEDYEAFKVVIKEVQGLLSEYHYQKVNPILDKLKYPQKEIESYLAQLKEAFPKLDWTYEVNGKLNFTAKDISIEYHNGHNLTSETYWHVNFDVMDWIEVACSKFDSLEKVITHMKEKVKEFQEEFKLYE